VCSVEMPGRERSLSHPAEMLGISIAKKITNPSGWKHDKKQRKIPAPLGRSAISLIVGATAVVTSWAITGTAQGQWLGISGWEEATTVRWQRLVNRPPFHTDNANLLTDGRVFVHEYNSPNWWFLTPDINGSYLNGTWSQAASMEPNYAPLYFANAVLPDGRVIVEGGEYNFLQLVWTNKGAIYDPLADSWTNVNPPAGWANIGDSPGIVQVDGIFMLGRGGLNSTKQQALLNPMTLTWTVLPGTSKSDTFVEEGFGLLPDGRIMIVDCQNIPNSELYDPVTQLWTSAGSTIVPLADASTLEIGPQIQRPDGNLVAFGGTPHNSIYHPSTGIWTPTADFPGGNDIADGPVSLLPDSNVLCIASPGVFQGVITIFIFDGISFTEAPPTRSSRSHQSWEIRTLLLPTGQVMYLVADGSTKDVELLTSTGRPDPSWKPVITSVPATLTRGTTVQISGRQFNGLSVGSDNGDDALSATNYPNRAYHQ
jgi:hypothetical protein